MDSITLLSALVDQELASERAALDALDKAESAPVPSDPDTIQGALPAQGATVGLHTLWARSLEAVGREDEADRIRFGVAERVNQGGYWRVLARIAAGLLERHPRQAAPLVSRARAQGGEAAVNLELLDRAHRSLPGHGGLAWQTAEARLAAGDEHGARRAAGRALPELFSEKNHDAAEGALLLLSEVATPAAVRAVTRSLEILAREGDWERFDTVIEVSGDILASPELAPLCWPVVHALWKKNPDHDPLRELVLVVFRGFVSGYPEPEAMVRISEIERPSHPAEAVLDRLQALLLFPPGYYVRHSGWGIGKVRDNDTATLTIDFPAKPLHRMTVSTAEKALETLPPGDLRVLLAMNRTELERKVREEPAEVMALALECLPGGEGAVDALRKVLVPDVLSSASWAAWWKKARAEAPAHPRIDASQAYRGFYRLGVAEDSEEEVPLPVWDPARDAPANLALLDTFLEHHPDARDRVLERFRETATGLTRDPGLSPRDRVSAGLWLLRMDPDAPVSPESEVGEGFPVNALSKIEQEQLVDRLRGERGLEALLASRLAGVRRKAWNRLENPEPVGRRALTQAVDRPEAALFVLEETLEVARVLSWGLPLLLALMDFLERPPRETHRKRAMALLDPASKVSRSLHSVSLTPDDKEALVTRLQTWQGSDRHRFPFLDFLRRANLGEIAEEVEGHRARAAARVGNRMNQNTEDPYAGSLVLTRATWTRLQQERTRVGMELKTVIPRAIQKARELGDLRENAEYEAARAKQVTYAKRFEELEALLASTQIIEDLQREAGVALPGTEIVLEPLEAGADPLTLWLLGEGDQELGRDVVSYKAPVGRALLGKQEGDTVDLPQGTGSSVYRIRSVRERLP